MIPAESEIGRVGDFELSFGESLRWDERRQRLYFVDCGRQMLHWLEEGEPPLQSLPLPSLPTGIALTTGAELVVCLDDGLSVVDPDAGSVEVLAPYPEGLGGRANDATADPAGNLVTGTLNLEAGPGSYWWFSATEGWRLIDSGIGNANGPAVVEVSSTTTLVFGDTHAGAVYAYPYDPDGGRVGPRRTYADYSEMQGAPDGATTDAEGAVWSCVLGAGRIARIQPSGVERLLAVGAPNPTDVAFGGPGLDRLYMTSVPIPVGNVPPPPRSRWLSVIDGLGVAGALEFRFRL